MAEPYYMDGAVTLYHGRCEDIMDELVPESFSMILADLPYATTRNTWDRPIDPKLLWWHYNRLVPANGAVLLFGSGLFSARMICSNEEGFKYALVWDKQAVTGFLNAKKQPLRAHEDLLVFYRNQPYYDPQMIDTGRRSHSRGKRLDRTINHYGQFVNTPVPEDQVGQHPRSILSFVRPKPSVHPTQKPLALCEWAIRSFAPEGTTVLDNVAGSGSTLLAAARTGRRALGIEIREDYCEMAANRLAARDSMEDPAWIKQWSKRQKETT